MSSDQLSPLVADLHLLTVLADTRSFTETARRLGASKASVSMRISELERAAGVTLVRRTTRSVGLTEAGQQLVNGMQPAFNRISESYSAVKDLVGTPRGLVRVTAPVALGRQHLAPFVAAFLKRYPDIHIELELTDRFVNLANEGFDLAIRHTNAPPETHVAWVLCETRSILLASPDYLARRGVPTQPSELAAHDCLLYLGNHNAASWTFVRSGKRKSREQVGVTITGTLKANNSEVLREALVAGLGIGLLPDFSAHRQRRVTRQPPLVQVLPDWQVQGFFGERIYALRPWSPQVPKAVQCLWSICGRVLPVALARRRKAGACTIEAPPIRFGKKYPPGLSRAPPIILTHEYTMEAQRHGRCGHRKNNRRRPQIPAGGGGNPGRPEAQQPRRPPGPGRKPGAGLRPGNAGRNRLSLQADGHCGGLPLPLRARRARAGRAAGHHLLALCLLRRTGRARAPARRWTKALCAPSG
jgi:DNA-binding transcriptional LysR family regulator